MRNPIFFIIIYSIFTLLGIYVYRYLLRIVDLTKLNRKGKLVRLAAALISAGLMYSVTRFVGYGLVLMTHILIIAWILDGIHFITKRVNKSFDVDSRLNKLYKSGTIPIILTAIILTYGFFNMRAVIQTDYEVKASKPIRQEGYTIALVSDLHYPTTMKGKELTTYVEKISANNPDFVVLAGDIVDEGTSKEEMKESLGILGQIKNKYGIYYVYGNHDSSSYSTDKNFTKHELYETLIENNIVVLEDSVHTINDEIAILGRADAGYGENSGRAKQEQLLAQVDNEDYLILLDHKPKDLKENAKLGIDLQLSGHTHAGQLWPAGIIGEWLGTNEQNYGLRTNGEYTSIVTSGIAGWGNSLRTAKRSEYVIIELNPGK